MRTDEIFSFFIVIGLISKIPTHPGAEFGGIAYLAIIFVTIPIIMVFSVVHGVFRQMDKNAKSVELGDKIFLGIMLVLVIILILLNFSAFIENIAYFIQNRRFI